MSNDKDKNIHDTDEPKVPVKPFGETTGPGAPEPPPPTEPGEPEGGETTGPGQPE